MELTSTHTHDKSKAVLIKEYPVAGIISRYKRELNMDVASFFNGIENIQLFECKSTGYQYYRPHGLSGDGPFYEALEHFDWYYMPWKWEHERTKKMFKKEDNILEVGSGGLGFVQKLSHEGYHITGLELNEHSIVQAKKQKLKVYAEPIQAFAKTHKHEFDVVCSFQVLEHISDVQSFIKAQIECLKPGGKLVICVPNNDAFIKHSEGGVLNFPPHHMGRWRPSSLKSLEKVFDLKLLKLTFEPLQIYHEDWYIKSTTDYFKKYRLVRGLTKFLSLTKIIKLYASFNNIKGHSMLAVYQKI